jgi:ABC-type transporter Mla MlaB component
VDFFSGRRDWQPGRHAPVRAVDFYQHDSAAMFRFVLRGELCGASVEELEHAWTAAASVMREKELVVDLGGLTGADLAGIALLSRMRESGARFTSALPPQSDALARWLGVPFAAPAGGPEGRRARGWKDRLLQVLRLSSQRA